MSHTSAFELFPVPSSPPSVNCPARSAGITPESTKALREVLKDNHERWHIFFDEVGRHNHITHHVLALWAMGAHKEIIEASYKKNVPLQRPRPNIPEPITAQNFNEHLGDKEYYWAYVEFFSQLVREKGMAAPLEEYVFSSKANFGSADALGRHPEMFNRFLSSILHPCIQVGYGVEFGLPGMMIEGLAETAVHRADSSPVLPEALFDSVWKTPNETPNETKPPVHAFTIAARILKDDKFALPKATLYNLYSNVMNNEELTKSLCKYVSEWTVNISDPGEIERKIEELQWLSVLLYAIPGADTQGVEFNADFLNMHMVTSSLFLPSIATCLSPMSQELLLRGFLAVTLAWWIGNSRPKLDIASFFTADTAHPIPPGPLPTPHRAALPSPESPIATTGNAWLPLLQQVISHPDDHYAKTMRALAHYSAVYGSREAGYFAGTELKGAELLDGTLFTRTAGLTARRLAVTEPDEYIVYFDRMGFHGNRK